MADDIDMLALRLAREGKEKSRALERRYYGDPARNVRFESERGVTMDDKELDAYCWSWNQWCFTRKYFLAPGAKNILARMQPCKVGLPPNAEMDADLNFFNMAIHALADMGDDDTECFVKFYAECAKNIKVVADKMNISVRTFYYRKGRFARRAVSMAGSMKRAQVNMAELKTKYEEDVD